MRFLQYAVVAAVPLLYISTENAASAFQTLPRNRRHRHHWRRPQKSELSLSFPSIAVNNPKPRRDSGSANQDPSVGDVYRRTITSSTIRKNAQVKPRLSQTVPSGQKQLPLHVRIAKGMYEESGPWIASFILPAFVSLVVQSSLPLATHLGFELIFFTYCTNKLFRKFDIPVTPEPLVNRKWEDVARLVWSSQSNTETRRDYLMGWFYDASFDRIRMEDALSYLAWMKYGLPLESGVLTDEEIDSLCEFDLPLLLDKVNDGNLLPKRQEREEPLSFIRFNCEPLRYRHKPMLFYLVTHGLNILLRVALEKSGFVYVEAKDAGEDLSYWYRQPSNDVKIRSAKESNPLVFIHGVGGLGFCYKLIEDIKVATQDDNVPIILIDLPHVSLRVYDEIPNIKSQVDSIFSIIDDVSVDPKCNGVKSPTTRATLVGHSYGTSVMSWMIQSRPERVSGCVFLDPICFQLHLKTILFNFHMQRVDERIQLNKKWDNPFSVGSLINLAGTEMHTNYAMLRQFSWATNALWPEDLMKYNVRSSIILSGNDEIVPVKEVEELFQTQSNFLDTHTFGGASHGDLFMDDDMRAVTVNKIVDVINTAKPTEEAEFWDFSRDLKSLFATAA